MTLPTEPLLPYLPAGATQYEAQLNRRLTDLFRETARQFNAGIGSTSSEETGTTAPGSGTYLQGAFVRNSGPVEQGEDGAKYVLLGWVCVASGTPGTWLEVRTLTGN